MQTMDAGGSAVRLVSWNVNALGPVVEGAAYRSSFSAYLQSVLGADILCVQEVKIPQDKLSAKVALPEGYDSYFSFSTVKRGYSGVATYVRTGPLTPVACETRPFGDAELDDEGRCVVTDHIAFVLFNVYVPNAGDKGRPRLDYKMRFLRALYDKLWSYHRAGRQLVVVGDFNIAMYEEDVYPAMACLPSMGYSEPELQWMRALVGEGGHCAVQAQGPQADTATGAEQQQENLAEGEQEEERQVQEPLCKRRKLSPPPSPAVISASHGSCDSRTAAPPPLQLVDLWRSCHPAHLPSNRHHFTVWDQKTDARARNAGVRIDYIFCSKQFAQRYCCYSHRGPGDGEMAGCDAATGGELSCPAAVEMKQLTELESQLRQPGCTCILRTPQRWSDHVAVMSHLCLPLLTQDYPAMLEPRKPSGCAGSSRRLPAVAMAAAAAVPPSGTLKSLFSRPAASGSRGTATGSGDKGTGGEGKSLATSSTSSSDTSATTTAAAADPGSHQPAPPAGATSSLHSQPKLAHARAGTLGAYWGQSTSSRGAGCCEAAVHPLAPAQTAVSQTGAATAAAGTGKRAGGAAGSSSASGRSTVFG